MLVILTNIVHFNDIGSQIIDVKLCSIDIIIQPIVESLDCFVLRLGYIDII